MEYRYILSSSLNPYRNLALEQALFNCVDEDAALLLLWQNDNTIVAGRNQDIRSECRVDAFLRQGGTLARRKSGGGAVYHDLGNLNYSIICRTAFEDKYRYYDLICNLMEQYGLKARYNGRNDITIGAKKISGNARYSAGEITCSHGTLLIQSDISVMERFLTPGSGKLERNHIKSVSARVANLSEYIPRITIETVINDLIKLYHMKILENPPSENGVKDWEIFFGNDKWIYGGIE